ncbi:MAG: flagellar hook-associated protein FlgK [Alphaproteobacteria bacterium]|nr:flagellar hook-associated protein FlgK [Alphaproteobacteria bacterium]
MSLTLALNTAISGLNTAQAGLGTISHNIANVNTEGYTRKILDPSSRVLAGTGAGVLVGDIRNSVDQNLLEDLRQEFGGFGLLQTKNTYFNRISDVFGTPQSNTSIAHNVSKLVNEFELLSTEVEKPATHLATVQAGISVADQLKRMSDTVQGLRLDADREIQQGILEMNGLMTSISTLNDQIALGSATDRQTEDLEDKRDVALNKLAELVDIQYFFTNNGSVSVFTTDGVTLVDSEPVQMAHVSLTRVNPEHSYAGGDFNGIFAGVLDITNDIRSGKLKGLIEMRDERLPEMQSQMDELARNFVEEVNLIHNRGTSYPSVVTEGTGSRQFLDSATQEIDITSGDVSIVLYNTDGSEAFSTKLGADLGFTTGTVDAMATAIQTYIAAQDPQLANATVAVNAAGELAFSLGTEAFGLAFRDETTAIKGSTTSDTTIQFDLDGDGNDDQTHSGFSNFFGMNDFFETTPKLSFWESDFKSANFTLGTVAARTLTFYDQTNGPAGAGIGTLVVSPGDTLQDIADAINADAALSVRIEAEVVPDGNGQKLRIQQIQGEQVLITQTAGTDAIDALGLDVSEVGMSSQLDITTTLKDDPSRISRGRVQFDNLTGRYFVSPGDNEVAGEMAALMTGQASFDAAGGISAGSITFAEYASQIVSRASTLSATASTEFQFQNDIKNALDLKHAQISGVNLDEELSQLLVFEQTYAASAKVISTTQQLFDILNNLV